MTYYRGAVYDRLGELQEKYACKEYLVALKSMQRFCGYSNSRIPQAQDISEFLQVLCCVRRKIRLTNQDCLPYK